MPVLHLFLLFLLFLQQALCPLPHLLAGACSLSNFVFYMMKAY